MTDNNEENKEELIKCSGCHSLILPKYFTIRIRTGRRYKTCDTCRNSRKRKCKHCDKVCGTAGDLRIHIKRVHDMIKDQECDQCDYKSSTACDLRRHIKSVHDKIRDHECNQCEYKCSRAFHLKSHIKIVHLKIKDHECDQCDHGYSTAGGLRIHIKRAHDKIKDHECGQCDYKCLTASDLRQHIKAVHDKIRDHECGQCDYKCSTASVLRKHIKMVHDKIKDHECDQCGFKCSTTYNLRKHMKSCTGDRIGSAGEVAVMDVLDNMGIKYEYNSTYMVRGKNPLRWDFIITGYEKRLFIEYDGRQHFEPVNFGNMSQDKAQKAFETQQRYDNIKNTFCSDNDHPLLRIPYKEFGAIPQLVTEFITKHTDWGAEDRD